MIGTQNSIDSLITKSIKNDYTLSEISIELKNRCNNIFKIISSDYKSIDDFLKSDVTDKEKKYKYIQEYIRCCDKRSNDLDWLIENKDNFKGLKDINLFGLIKLKDKLNKNETRENRNSNR